MSSIPPQNPSGPVASPEPLRVEQAQRIILEAARPVVDAERLSLHEALGRVLAVDVVSPVDVPAHDNSAMDGYAVRSSDLAGDGERSLRVVGTATAGHPFDGILRAGEAVRIMTGAVVPEGADAVVVQESSRPDGHIVHLPAGVAAGRNLRRRGEDLACGRTALAAGRRLRATDLGLVASIGDDSVTVLRRPRVALLSTGDELRGPGEPLGPGEVYDCNRPTLAALLARLGCETIDLGAVGDDPARLERRIGAAGAQADAIISSGGVSVGEADHTRSILARLGNVAFWQVEMRPGRPLAFGRVGGALYFGLPGNPVAAVVAFEVMVRGALQRIAGDSGSARPTLRARCAAPVAKRPGRSEFPRARLEWTADGSAFAVPLANQGTGTLRPLAEADCLILLDHGRGPVQAGEMVDCLLLDAG